MSDEVLVAGTDPIEPGGTANADGTPSGADGKGEAKPEGDATAKTGDEGKAEGDKPEGVPEKYEFTVPEGMVLDEAKAAEFTEIAKELKLSQESADKIVGLYAKSEQARVEAHKATVDGWKAEVKADKEIGGDKLAQTIATANKAVDLGPPELKAFLKESGLGNHPLFIKWAYGIGKAMTSDDIVRGGSAPAEADLAKKMFPNMT
jgi:hypothetical protein